MSNSSSMMNAAVNADDTIKGYKSENTVGESWQVGKLDYNKYHITDWWDHDYYPRYYQHTVYEDKGEKAISIVKALMDSKTIQVKTVKQFVDLLDRIMKIL